MIKSFISIVKVIQGKFLVQIDILFSLMGVVKGWSFDFYWFFFGYSRGTFELSHSGS